MNEDVTIPTLEKSPLGVEERNRRSWRSVDVFIVLIFYVALLYIFLFLQAKVLGGTAISATDTPGFWLLGEVVDACLLSVLPIFVVVRLYRAAVRDIGLSTHKLRSNVLIGVVSGTALWILASLFDAFTKVLVGTGAPNSYLQLLQEAPSSFSYAAILMSILVLGPVSEEIYFRGFGYTIFRKNYGKAMAVIFSSVLFTVFHFNILSAPQVLLLGFGLALLFEYTESLLAPIAAHSVINLLTVLLNRA